MTAIQSWLLKELPSITSNDAEGAEKIVKEIFSPLVHLTPPCDWKLKEKLGRSGYVRWCDQTRRQLAVTIPIRFKEEPKDLPAPTDGILPSLALLRPKVRTVYAEGTVSRRYRTISTEDQKLLKSLVRASARASRIIMNSSDSRGMLASTLAPEIVPEGLMNYLVEKHAIKCDPYPILRHIRELANKTYENQRMAYGLVFCEGESEIARYPDDTVTDKRFTRLTDGISTALLINKKGYVEGLAQLPRSVQPSPGRSFYRPRWLDPLAEYSRISTSLAIALTRNGDLHVLDSGRYLASRRSGRWIVWNHNENVNILFDQVGANAPSEKRVIQTLYRAALDLSARRSGALFVWLNDEATGLKKLIPVEDQVGSATRGKAEIALDGFLASRTVGNSLDRSILVDLASLDGAVVVSTTGKVLAFGSVLRSRSSHIQGQGARTRAAIAASKFGLAIKVGSDGDITTYYQENEVFML